MYSMILKVNIDVVLELGNFTNICFNYGSMRWKTVACKVDGQIFELVSCGVHKLTMEAISGEWRASVESGVHQWRMEGHQWRMECISGEWRACLENEAHAWRTKRMPGE